MDEDVMFWTVNLFDKSSDLSAGPTSDCEEVDYFDRLVNVPSRQANL